jgi:Phage tail protein
MTVVAPDTAEVQASYLCPPTNDVSATLRGLTMHHHDPPYVLLDFNPWSRQVRADAEAAHAWADGGWSGHEWADMVTVPINLLVKTDDVRGTPAWLALQQALAAAFAPSHVDLPLTFTAGADSYLIYGRPRLVEPLAETAFRGWAICRAAFRALDPAIYSGTASEVTLMLPQEVGGLLVPFTVPFTIDATVTAGAATITNAGTQATGLLLTFTGPVSQPRVTLTPSGGATQTLRYLDDLEAGQTLTVDTKARTAYLNGTVSRRGRMAGDWPLLEPGSSELSFNAAAYNASATLTVAWRSAWY